LNKAVAALEKGAGAVFLQTKFQKDDGTTFTDHPAVEFHLTDEGLFDSYHTVDDFLPIYKIYAGSSQLSEQDHGEKGSGLNMVFMFVGAVLGASVVVGVQGLRAMRPRSTSEMYLSLGCSA